MLVPPVLFFLKKGNLRLQSTIIKQLKHDDNDAADESLLSDAETVKKVDASSCRTAMNCPLDLSQLQSLSSDLLVGQKQRAKC
jgi:hypothetical protein